MSVATGITVLVVLVVLHLLTREVRIMRKVQRSALPTNHRSYRPLTSRERRRIYGGRP